MQYIELSIKSMPSKSLPNAAYPCMYLKPVKYNEASDKRDIDHAKAYPSLTAMEGHT
jgi:hypothetical protein